MGNVTEENILLQLRHLRTLPAVASKLSTGEVHLHGWVYDIEHGTVSAYDEEQGKFVSIEERYASLISNQGPLQEVKLA